MNKIRHLFLCALLGSAPGAFAQQSVTFTRPVVAGSDDAEQHLADGSMDLGSSDLELMVDGSTQQQLGVRFTNLAIPQGATILNAYIQFTTKGDKAPVSGTISIKGQDVDNAATFTSATNNISSRTLTTGAVSWAGSTDAS